MSIEERHYAFIKIDNSYISIEFWDRLLTDFELDKINKKNRPLVTGKATKKQLIVNVCLLNAVALLLCFFINYYALCISIAFIVFGIAYSHPRVDLKSKFLLKTLVTSAGAGLMYLLGGTAVASNLDITKTIATTSSYIIGNNFPLFILSPVAYTAVFFFVFCFVLGPFGDIGDIKGDKAVGRRTFPIAIGISPTIALMMSIPIMIISLTLLSFYYYNYNNNNIMVTTNLHMNLPGTCLVISTCIYIIIFIDKIRKRLDNGM